MKLQHLFALIGWLVAAPAFADKYFAVTPSGSAEMLFGDAPQQVVGKLSSKCIDVHWTVTTSSSNELVCEAPMSFGQSLLGTLAMGNSYSTPPRRFFRFNVAEVNGISRVQASGWMELQMAFGQMKRTDFSGPAFQNSIFNFMSAAGGKFPVGTTFPNHVVMGFVGSDAPVPGGMGLRVTSIVPGSAAAAAGLQIDDVVYGVSHKHWKNSGQYLDAMAKAAETPTYEVELQRAGQPVTLTFNREFRSAVTEQVTPSIAASTSGSSLGTADELAKLAKLKDQGVITQDEFLAQKKKLLEQ